MLIDRTYFTGAINIPNTNKTDIMERLNWFIEKYEPEFLNDLLGYSFYKEFKNGLIAPVPEQRWLDLLKGVEYTNRSWKLTKWKGLIPDLTNITIDYAASTYVIVGRGQTYDPIPGSNTALLPTSVVGKIFSIEQRTFGQLRPDEYTVSGNLLTLLNWNFSNGDTYFYNVQLENAFAVSGTIKESIIANYIYWQWMKDQFTQSSGIGEVVTKAENAIVITPEQKMIRAWNEMHQGVCECMDFLSDNESIYPEWDRSDKSTAIRKYWRINSFGI